MRWVHGTFLIFTPHLRRWWWWSVVVVLVTLTARHGACVAQIGKLLATKHFKLSMRRYSQRGANIPRHAMWASVLALRSVMQHIVGAHFGRREIQTAATQPSHNPKRASCNLWLRRRIMEWNNV